MKVTEELAKLAFDLFKILFGAALIGVIFTEQNSKTTAFVWGISLGIFFLAIGIILTLTNKK